MQQMSLLVKAAQDADAIRERMEKSAFFGTAQRIAGRGLRAVGSAFGRGPKPVAVSPPRLPTVPTQTPVMPKAGPEGAFGYSRAREQAAASKILTPPAPPAQPRNRLALSALGIGGVGTGGALGYGHLRNDAADTVGKSWNPLTWGGGNSAEDVYKANLAKWNAQRQELAERMKAVQDTDPAKYQELERQWQSGDHGQSAWSLGGLNPFASRSAARHQELALSAQDDLQKKYTDAMGKVGPRASDPDRIKEIDENLTTGRMLPGQAEELEAEKARIRRRMETAAGTESSEAAEIRKRMEAAGMRMRGVKPPPQLHPYGAWHVGVRPGGTPGNAQGFGKGRYDYRQPQRDVWEDVIANNNSIFG
jgi:hypothetical protein